MSTYLTGPALVIDATDAARVDRQLRDAIRLAWLARGLHPPRALVDLADQLHRLAKHFPAPAQVTALAETAPANPAAALALCAQTGHLTADQAAAIMGISPQHVRGLARRGVITGWRAAGRGTWGIDSASALAWAADRWQTQHTGRAA